MLRTVRSKVIGTAALFTLLCIITGGTGWHYARTVGQEGYDVGARLAPLGDAAMEIKLTATTAHLIFEEIMAGDEGEDVEQVWALLDEILWYCDAILKGGENEEGTFFASDNPRVLETTRNVREGVVRFIASAHSRYETRVSMSGSGSEADQLFDAAYEKIITSLQAIIDRTGSDFGMEEAAIISGEARFILADTHLFFEEYLSGDASISFEDITAGLIQARKSIEGLSFYLNDSEIDPILAEVDDFINAANERNQNYSRENVAGSEVDMAFDREFENFITQADEAEELIHADMLQGLADVSSQLSSSQLTLGIILGCALLAAILLARTLVRTIMIPLGGEPSELAGMADEIAEGNLLLQFHRTGAHKDSVYMVMKRMVDGLQGKASIAASIARGDIGIDVDAASDKDILGNAYVEMVERLNHALSQVNEAAEQLEQGTEQIRQSSDSLSGGATQQAASIEEISSSMNEIGSQTTANADNAGQANTLARSAFEAATAGAEEMANMTRAMDEINESSQSISKIIKAIDEIAFQTNLLALNAAVEAARAGKHGKGFAVVAEEVRNLAARSAKAAKETAELIEGSLAKVRNGSDIAGNTAGALSGIVEGSSQVADLLAEIAAASNEQAQGIAQVNQGLSQVEEVTQQNTATAEQASSASEQLAGQARNLRQLLAQFRLRDQDPTFSSGNAYQLETHADAGEPFQEESPLESAMHEKELPVPTGRKAGPEDIIALDDDEFGKY